jgi:hypothetical protein
MMFTIQKRGPLKPIGGKPAGGAINGKPIIGARKRSSSFMSIEHQQMTETNNVRRTKFAMESPAGIGGICIC